MSFIFIESHSTFLEVESFKNEISFLKTEVEKKEDRIRLYEEEVTKLHEMLVELKRARFGKKSERWESGEQLVFNEVEALAKTFDAKEQKDDSEEEIKVEAYIKKRGHRKPLPKNLEREVIVLELSKDECFSKDGEPLKVIGFEISEKLSYEPAKTKVIEYRRAKYGIDCGDYVKTAPMTASILPKSIATAELVASIVSNKYAYGLPLYRQEDIFSEIGVEIPRQTMARWIIECSKTCMPIWNILNERLLENTYVSCDETPLQVLKEKNRAPESKSWMWVRGTPHGENRILLFDYDPSRSQKVAQDLFLDFKGYLQADGYGGYNALSKQDGVIRIGCNMHGRRYFEKAKKIGAKSGQSYAEVGLKFYQKLYALEGDFRQLDSAERYKKRLETHQPIWDAFQGWVHENVQKVPPKSAIGVAFNYFLSEYKHLTGYLADGRLEMDNGFTERAIRKFAIGRNNWMFSDTEAGAEASALFYSFLCTAKINDVQPYDAMKYLFTELPKAKTESDFKLIADYLMGIKNPI